MNVYDETIKVMSEFVKLKPVECEETYDLTVPSVQKFKSGGHGRLYKVELLSKDILNLEKSVKFNLFYNQIQSQSQIIK